MTKWILPPLAARFGEFCTLAIAFSLPHDIGGSQPLSSNPWKGCPAGCLPGSGLMKTPEVG